MIRRLAGAVALLLTWTAAPAEAQVYLPSADAPRRGSVELSGGLVWIAGFEVDSLPAELTANAGNNAPPVTLFDTASEVRAARGAQARVGVFLSPTISLEAGVRFSQPVLAIRVFDDFEDAPDLTVEQTMSRYVFDGSLLVHPQRWRFADGRGMPFVIAGAGYLRELHDGRELVETGQSYHGGLGVKYWLTEGRRRLGLRGDALVVVRDGGYAGEAERRAHPALGITVAYVF